MSGLFPALVIKYMSTSTHAHIFQLDPRLSINRVIVSDCSIREHPKGAIIGTCDICDTDYNIDD